ncbi:LacI family DNA-binding transcriptional regulator [Frondihabitans sp. PhB188]|uniref:LacI family DNA-binding transcriptional regulator n=1 Tax=Frondihabitans sp. PhB188 TaxID=2485200 RepID=UPI000F4A45FD|nr:LacI family DNA-binding transcriptional regulator [Frondihabitans sp. PhB188]
MSRATAKPASIADVARVAGVSVPTVSRVLTGAAKVSPDKRDRVLLAIDELGYRPNGAARALVSGKQRIIAVMTSETAIFGYSATIQGIETAARAEGYFVVISVVENPTEDEAQRAVELVLGQPLAGIIVLKFDPVGVRVLEALPPDIPRVAVSGEVSDEVSQASIEEVAAGEEIVRYLLSLGHPTVHHVTVPASRDEDHRTTGWRNALVEAGAEVPEIIPATWDASSGVRIGRRLAADDSVTAIFCGNDEIAMGVITGLSDAGRNVPADVSVVGFDDHPLARIWRPGITTIAQDFPGLGRRAFELLQAQLDGDAAVARSTSRPPLVVRESAGPPRVR